MTIHTKPIPYLICILLVLAALGCVNKTIKPEISSNISIAWDWYNKGNLIPKLDHIYELKGRTDGINQVSLGRFAVYPGHYLASLEVDLKDLVIPKGETIEDVLEIKLILYDEKGNVLPNFIRFKNQIVDASRIDFPLHGLTNTDLKTLKGFYPLPLLARYYPWDTGWIPSVAKEAEIVVALSGPGEINFKNPIFEFSKWNFTLIERVDKLKTYNQWGLFPPKVIQELKTSKPIQLSTSDQICFEIKGWDETNRARILDALNKALTKFNNLSEICNNATSKLNIKIQRDLTLIHNDEFKIHQSLDSHQLLVASHSARAMQFALDTLRRIFKIEDNIVTLLPYNISDYPSFKERGVSAINRSKAGELENEINAVDWLPESRLNTLWIEPTERNPIWWSPNKEYKDKLALLAAKVNQRDLFDLGLSLNVYAHRAEESNKQDLSISSQDFHSKIKSALAPYLKNKISKLMLRSDDFVPHLNDNIISYALTNRDDFFIYQSLASAHSDLLNQVYSYYEPKKFQAFVPPWYNNFFIGRSPQHSENYFRELSTIHKKKIDFVWTGPTVRSLDIDEFQYQRFKNKIGKNNITLWDNTLYARRHKDLWGDNPERLALTSIFEPFDIHISKDLLQNKEFTSSFYANADVTELMRIQLATLGSFLWNPEKYNPEQALWSYLTDRFGEKAALEILNFDAVITEIKAFKLINTSIHPEALLKQAEAMLEQLKSEPSSETRGLISEFERNLASLKAR